MTSNPKTLNAQQFHRPLRLRSQRLLLPIGICLLLLLGLQSNVRASHAMGLDLTYECLGGDSFAIKLAFYRDCDGIDAPGFDGEDLPEIDIISSSCGISLTEEMEFVSVSELTAVCDGLNTTCSDAGSPYPGIEEYIYRDTIELPSSCADWIFSYGLCCRNNDIVTIDDPDDQEIYVETSLDNLNYPCNSSPDFSNPPIPFSCVNAAYCFNNGAFDTDGDSLVFKLVTPTTGPDPEDTVDYLAGFSTDYPIDATPALTLDQTTGDICLTPTTVDQITVIQVQAEEWRDGNMISTIDRDIQIRPINCVVPNEVPTVDGIDGTGIFTATICAGDTFRFYTQSDDLNAGESVTMTWNGGIADATFDISNATLPRGEFTWFPQASDVSTTPHCFTVTVEDDHCPFVGTQTYSFCLTVSGLMTVDVVPTGVSCSGDCDGSAVANVTGGTSPYTYIWDDPGAGTDNSISSLCAGDYTVTVTDAAGCSPIGTDSVTAPLILQVSLDSTETNCNGECNGTAIGSALGGTSPFDWLWDDPADQTSSTASGLCAGVVNVTLTDDNDCEATGAITITEPTALTASISDSTLIRCNGLSNGQAIVTPSGGVAPYTYLWNDTGAQTDSTATNLPAGTYTVTTTDANGCEIETTTSLTEPDLFTITTLEVASDYNGAEVSCIDACDGVLNLTVTGASAPYDYLWNDPGGQTSNNPTGLCTGTFAVTITDDNNCDTTAQITITPPTAVGVDISDSTLISCFGEGDGDATVTASGGIPGYTYLWDDPANQNTSVATALIAGTYTVTVTDANGCDTSVAVTLTEPTVLAVDTLYISSDYNGRDVTCVGACDGQATAAAEGGTSPYTYVWDDPAGQTGTVATGLCSGTVTVTMTDNQGCTITDQITLSDPPVLTSSITDSSATTCRGLSNGTAIVTPAGGTADYTFLWSASAGAQTDSTATNLSTGTHSVTVTDANGCTTVASVIIDQPTFLSVDSITITTDYNGEDISCYDACDGAVQAHVSGATPGYTYLWNDPGAQTTPTPFGLCDGTFSVTVTDDNGCDTVAQITITPPTALSLDIADSTLISCFSGNDGQATVSATNGTPGYTYLWDDPANQNTSVATALIAGTYTVTVTDANGCDTSVAVTLTEPTILAVDTLYISSDYNGRDVTCFGACDGQTTAAAEGGTSPYTYVWDDPAGQTGTVATGLCAGTVNVTMTDNQGCTITDQISLSNPPILTSSITDSSATTCRGLSNGTAIVTPAGGTADYAFLWSASAGAQTDSTATNLSTGTHSVTVTDANGCTTVSSVIIDQPTFLSVDSITITTDYNGEDISCYDACDGAVQAHVSGATPGYTYVWNDPAAQTTPTPSGLCDGTFSVTVTDNNGCDTVAQITITPPTALSLDIADSTLISCFSGNDGQATVLATNGTPGYSYLWDDPANQNTSVATALIAGSYTVTVTDANGCDTSVAVTLTEPTVLAVNAIEVVSDYNGAQITCADTCDGSASVTGAGGTTPYTYAWSNGTTTQVTTGLCAETYGATITDALGCEADSNITLTAPDQLEATFSSIDSVNCTNGSDGQATIAPTAGTPPYTYLWSASASSQTTSTAAGLTAGIYVVSVFDANDCQISRSDTLFEPDLLVVASIDKSSNYNGSDVSCNGICDGTALANAEGGTPPYNYAWSNGQMTREADMLCADTYLVTVTDDNGCDTSASVSLTDPDLLTVDITDSTLISCRLGQDGQAVITPTGGTATYSFQWDDQANAQTDSTAVGLTAGTFSVTVSDANGCDTSTTVTLTEPNLLRAILDMTPATCFNYNDGVVEATPTEGTPPYAYSWSTGETNNQAQALSAGTYELTITDALNCFIDTSLEVTHPDTLELDAGSDQVICVGVTANLSATPTGGNGTFSFVWSEGLGNQSTAQATPLATQQYLVTVTDQLNCTQLDSVTVEVMDLFADQLELLTGRDICINQITNVSATHDGQFGPYTYTWSHPIGNDLGPYAVSPVVKTQYGITVTDVCDNSISDTATIVVDPYPVIDMPDTLADDCSPVTVTFNNAATNQDGISYWWTFDDGAVDSVAVPTHTFDLDKTYRIGLTLTSPNVNCRTVRNPQSVVVVRPHPPTLPDTDPGTIDDCATPTALIFDESQTAIDWLWNISDGTTSEEQIFEHTFPDTGMYEITLLIHNEFDCESYDTLSFYVSPCDDLIVPTGFTPSSTSSSGGRYTPGDMSNDIFHPQFRYVDEYHLMIFNRWGELIFESFDPDVGWDGYYRGQLCQQDAYVWRIDVVFLNGKELSETGSVTLIR